MQHGIGLIVLIFLVCGCSVQRAPSGFERGSSNSGLTCQSLDAFRSNELSAQAIYGTDNRLDWYEAPGQTTAYWARATAALMPAHALEESEQGFELTGPSYQSFANLCPGHRFAQQPSIAFCSGFLVGEDLLVTAGHCIRSESECGTTRFVFDYAKQESSQENYQVSHDEVYHCDELIGREVGLVDYAVVRLDRKVKNRVPLNLRREGEIRVGEQVMLIGHPMGLPSKIADGGFVLSKGTRILASVDAFAANSGSPVLNTRTGRVEGLLVSGERDFIFEEGCRREAHCGPSCRGEGLTPISHLLKYIDGAEDFPNPVCD